MGQMMGKAKLKSEALLFSNLPKEVMLELRESFSDLAEGYSLKLQELQSIVSVSTKEYFTYTDERMKTASEALFLKYDDDCNGLVDSFEFLSSLSLVSAMTMEEKATYIFELFHLGDELGVLTVSEVSLAFQTSLSGLCKIYHGVKRPINYEIEQFIALAMFQPYTDSHKKVDDHRTVLKEDFVRLIMSNAVVSSWLHFVGDL